MKNHYHCLVITVLGLLARASSAFIQPRLETSVIGRHERIHPSSLIVATEWSNGKRQRNRNFTVRFGLKNPIADGKLISVQNFFGQRQTIQNAPILRKLKKMSMRCHLAPVLLSLLAWQIFPSLALASVASIQISRITSTIRRIRISRVVSVVRRNIRPALYILAIYLLSSSLLHTVRVKQRQSNDATSEWGRYASNPAARGRAVVSLCLKLIPFWLVERTILRWSPERQTRSRELSGRIFSDGLLQLGPLYIKLGQIVSCRDNFLSPEWVKAMERLQDRVPARRGAQALELAYQVIGGRNELHQVFSHFDDEPLAAASLGQVHRAVLRGSNETVAVKLQRPMLRQIYDQDLTLLSNVAKVMDNMVGKRSKLGGVSQSWVQIFDDAKAILYREIDYRDEAENAIRFCNDFGLGKGGKAIPAHAKSRDNEYLPSASDWFRVPYTYRNLSSEKILVMEFVPSIKISNFKAMKAANVTMADREALADSLARAYLRQFCCNLFFSTDPHPGNLGVEIRSNGDPPRLVMYDFGQAASLKPPQADGILEVIESIVDSNVDQSVEAFQKMGVLKPDADLHKVRAKVADNFRTGKVKANRKRLSQRGYKFAPPTNYTESENSSISGTDSEVLSFFTLPAEYAFVARALSQMDGVGRGLDPEFDFVSSAAPYIVEIKGTGKYLKDEFQKALDNILRQVKSWFGE